MTREELLSPRYIVVFYNGRHYPTSAFVDGDIIVRKKLEAGKALAGWGGWTFTDCNGKLQHTQIDFSEYPHLFRALRWWEYRKPEDMPKYVQRCDYPAMVKQIDSWVADGSGFFYGGRNVITSVIGYLPISEEEYLKYAPSIIVSKK